MKHPSLLVKVTLITHLKVRTLILAYITNLFVKVIYYFLQYPLTFLSAGRRYRVHENEKYRYAIGL